MLSGGIAATARTAGWVVVASGLTRTRIKTVGVAAVVQWLALGGAKRDYQGCMESGAEASWSASRKRRSEVCIHWEMVVDESFL
jgi:hypothetical protein